MRTIQMTLDDNLVKEVDAVIKKLHTTRSAFTRQALASELERYRERQLEAKHRKGYALKPADHDEFAIWEKEQAWGDG